jgi:hypothetical protein
MKLNPGDLIVPSFGTARTDVLRSIQTAPDNPAPASYREVCPAYTENCW